MAYDVFMDINGIPGESSDEKHKNWIELTSISFGVDQPVSVASATGGRTGGRADFSPITVTKQIDKAGPDLAQHCSSGKHISEVKFEFCEATDNKHTFLTVTLKNVTVSKYHVTGTSSDTGGGLGMSKPEEAVSLAYGEIKWKYQGLDHTGKAAAAVERGWNLEQNKKV